ncbi:DUF2254 domain-containing protein [Kitasatospora kifunensis]|uniref:Putative membrane protein n=1 Tax=Kitasatospora kifunensis TaxID=58351 RepID=A0A7W7VYW9_KITKI|nr:DUF2254 domain-containing protein [Kitasatospora kifunensis]MBB4927134.1 putative membrane protein [Kitasatospora kifunensis]
MPGRAFLEADWRRETLRTNLWLVPAIEALFAVLLFVMTTALDRAAYDGRFKLATWVLAGTADGARQILTTIAAAIITVVGLVFSITIVALTLASTQFGPRMLRNFIRDRGTQLALGAFVATFCYTVLVLVVISPGPHGDFVPHLSITVALGLTGVDLAVLIYFINHIATMIQLPQVIAGIATDLARAIEAQGAEDQPAPEQGDSGPGREHLLALVAARGAAIPTTASGYLQYISHERLVRIATETDAVIHLPYRPGHFMVQGQPLAVVWPAERAERVARQLRRGQITGPYRTLAQDISFGVDQLVEIAIRALSPAVNDTFTALTCIDWLGDCLCRINHGWHPQRVHRDRGGRIRLIAYQADYDRLVQRSFEKIRQSAGGMPAVMIRQLETLGKVMEQTVQPKRRAVLLEQGAMIWRLCEATVPEPADREDVRRRYEALCEAEVTISQVTSALRSRVQPG